MNVGVYNSEIVAIGLTKSQPGNCGVWVTVEVDDGFGGAREEMTGRIWITDAAMGMAKKQLDAIGFDWKKTDLSMDTLQICIGNEVEVTLKEEAYKNRKEVKIAFFGGGSKPPTEAEISRAMTMLRAKKDATEGPQDAPESTRSKKASSGHAAVVYAMHNVANGQPVANASPTVAEPPKSREPGEDEDDGVPFLWFLPILAMLACSGIV